VCACVYLCGEGGGQETHYLCLGIHCSVLACVCVYVSVCVYMCTCTRQFCLGIHYWDLHDVWRRNNICWSYVVYFQWADLELADLEPAD